MTEPVCSAGSGGTEAVAVMAQPSGTTPNERGCFMLVDTCSIAGQGLRERRDAECRVSPGEGGSLLGEVGMVTGLAWHRGQAGAA